MDVVRPDAAPGAVKPGVGEATEAAQEGESFDKVMSEVDGSTVAPQPPEAQTAIPRDDTRVAELTEEKTRIAESPGGIERLGQEIESGSVRLRELISELQSGRSFTSQELIGMQAEMHEITLQIEVTTRVVTESVSGVKQLAQQQG